MPAKRNEGECEASTRRYLGGLPDDLARSPLAASALVMARGLDDVGNSFTSKAMGQARFQEALDRLRELAPSVEEKDELDDLAARRARRLASAGSSAI